MAIFVYQELYLRIGLVIAFFKTLHVLKTKQRLKGLEDMLWLCCGQLQSYIEPGSKNNFFCWAMASNPYFETMRATVFW